MKMETQSYKEEIGLPEGVSAEAKNGELTVRGPKGAVSRTLKDPMILVDAEGGNVTITIKRYTKRQKKLLGTFKAHIRNMIKGAAAGHVYRMKICSGHFPMNVSMKGGHFEVKNFLGEKVPRRLLVEGEGVTVKVDGPDVIIEGTDKELCGRIASEIEMLTKRSGYDRRVFQDGIYITEKDGKAIS